MARIDSLLSIANDQGANELRIGSDREPKMLAYGAPKRLNIPSMSLEVVRELLGEILSPEREAALSAKGRLEVPYASEKVGGFEVKLSARPGGLDATFLRDGGRAAKATAPAAKESPAVAGAAPAVLSAPVGLPGEAQATAVASAEPRGGVLPSDGLVRLLAKAGALGASDLHLSEGDVPAVRIDGQIRTLDDEPVAALREAFVWEGSAEHHVAAGGSIDAAADVAEIGRVRLHVYSTASGPAASIRLLPRTTPSLAALGLPVPLDDLALLPNGLVLLCGATGAGKSTTLAAIADEALRRRSILLVTLEDPIEFTLSPSSRSIVRRRWIGRDAPNFASGLRDALREDPDLILVGEMRDPETIGLALTAAETGHLVLASIHSRSSASAIERIVDAYPPERQRQVRVQLAESIRAIVAQRLLPRARGGGRVVAVEVLRGTRAVASIVREGKTEQLTTALQSSQREGMITLERCLANLVQAGDIKLEDARAAANEPESLAMYLNK